ncbi:MAG: hypothetical protein V4510_04495 [bacterium]
MRKIVLQAKALKWGNSYGFRITKADFERAGLHIGQEVQVDVVGRPGKFDLSQVPSFRLGSLTREDRDAAAEARWAEKQARSRGPGREKE